MSSDRTKSATSWQAITPSNTDNLTPQPVGVYVGTAGNLAIEGETGPATLVAVPAGSWLPIQPLKVLATGTTAADIVAFYN